MNTKTDNAENRSLHSLVREPATPEREKKNWWAVVDGGVVCTTGYRCTPHNPDMWWCPSVGYSLAEKYHLFETEEDALRKAVVEAERHAAKWTKIVEQLKARLPNEKLSDKTTPQQPTDPSL